MELLLHRAICQNDILQPVRLLVAVAVTGRQVTAAGVVVGIKTGARVALRVVVRNTTGVRMGFIGITREAHFEPIAIAGLAVVIAVVEGLAITGGDRSAGARVIIAIVRIIVGRAIRDLVSGARTEFDIDSVGVSAAAVRVVFALTIINSAAVGAAALQFKTGVGIVLRPTGFDVHMVSVNMEPVVRSFDCESGELYVALAGIHHETVLRIVREREGCRPADRHAAGHMDGRTDRVSARNINRRSRSRVLDGIANVGFRHVRTHSQCRH